MNLNCEIVQMGLGWEGGGAGRGWVRVGGEWDVRVSIEGGGLHSG